MVARFMESGSCRRRSVRRRIVLLRYVVAERAPFLARNVTDSNSELSANARKDTFASWRNR